MLLFGYLRLGVGDIAFVIRVGSGFLIYSSFFSPFFHTPGRFLVTLFISLIGLLLSFLKHRVNYYFKNVARG